MAGNLVWPAPQTSLANSTAFQMQWKLEAQVFGSLVSRVSALEKGSNGSTSGGISSSNLSINLPLIPTEGGTGLSTLGSANQVLGVNSTGVAMEYKTISGTTHQISVTNATGSITLSTPQNIDTTSSVTFSSAALTTGQVTTTPVNPTDLANKLYVDAAVANLTLKVPCYASTTANLPYTYNNSAGTLTATSNGAFTTDGLTPPTNARILVMFQTTQYQNGVYSLTTPGSGSTAPVLTRTSDFNSSANIEGGDFVFVEGGTLYGGTAWALISDSTYTVGTTAIVWNQIFGAGAYTAGTGLTLTGTQFSLTSPVTTSLGGTGLTSTGTNDQILGVVHTGSGLEYKSLAAGSGVTITPTAGTITIAATGSGGTVTSVGLTVPSWLSVSGSPVTTSGTLAITATSGETANLFLATPNGTTGAVGLRSIVAGDLPAISLTTGVSGILPTANGGTGANISSPAQGTILYFNSSNVGAALAVGTANQVLTTGGASANPSYQNIASLLTASTGIAISGTTNASIRAKRPLTLTFMLGYTPTSTGGDVVEIVVPYSPTDGTTSLTYNLRRFVVHLGTASTSGSFTIKVESSNANTTTAFASGSVTNMQTGGDTTLSSGTYTASTTTFSTTSISSGALMRVNVTGLGTNVANCTCYLELEEQ